MEVLNMGETKQEDHSFSFDGWDLIEFIKGRKKNVVMCLALVGAKLLGIDVGLSEIVVASLFEMAVGVGEYYVKK
jgi:hypothetical protein